MNPPSPPDWRLLLGEQLAPILAALSAGDDVAPARLHRAEGFAQAVVALGLADAEAVAGFIRACYRETLGEARCGQFEEADFRRGELPAIPFRLPRAPVYPSSA
ncbi:MAG: hypothetical protein ACKO4A_14520 [Gammaproteobacteria bacterium]